MKTQSTSFRPLMLVALLLVGCDEAPSSSSEETASEDWEASLECDDASNDRELAVCAAEAFLETLDADERAAVLYDASDAQAKTLWSNLPGVQRSGITLGELDDESRAAAMVVARVALSEQGYADYVGILAADDYLGEQGGGGGPGGGSQYSSDNYVIAFIGTPSAEDDWMLQLGGHHMAFNIAYVDGDPSPTPNHLGVEPKGEFTVGGETYAPLDDDAAAFFAIFDAMDSDVLAAAAISGSYSDVLLGPDEYGTGSLDAVAFPTGDSREGVLVSSLADEDRARVIAAIAAWVEDYPDDIAIPLMDAYTSDEALADTYVGWAGSGSPDPDVDGTYLRLDGPRVWIELACQGGVVIQGQTHYHTIFRDEQRDYGASL